MKPNVGICPVINPTGKKRHRIPKSDGSDEHIKAEDLTVGMELTIYGKTIKVRSAPASSGLRRLSRLI